MNRSIDPNNTKLMINLTGRWKGKYRYGSGYPPKMIGKSEPFEFDITDENGAITGTCMDEVVKAMPGNESYITGTFASKEIRFKKRYKYHLAIEDDGAMILEPDMVMDGVDYTGRFYRSFFRRKPCFSGTWSITSWYKDENDQVMIFVCSGSWKMSKAD